MDGYGTDQGLTDYAAARGVTLPVGDKTTARLRGSMSLDGAYAVRWPGTRASMTQFNAWPRTGATYSDGSAISGVPSQVEYASYEYAIQELKSPGSTSPVVTPGKVKTRARVEGAVDVSYGAAGSSIDDAVAAMVPVNTVVDGLLVDIVGARSGVFGVLVV